jgi:UDP-glucose 4-epimerase
VTAADAPDASGRTLLVTGATGFVGGAIARAWRSTGGEAIGLVQGDRNLAHADNVNLHRSTYSADDIAAAVERFAPDVVLHAAGTASVASSLSDPARDFAASVGTFHALLEGVRRSGRRPRVLYPSSAAVYGEPQALPVSESAPVRPLSPYGHHKAIGELLGREYAVCFGIPVLVFRLFSVFGPHQNRLLVRELFDQLRNAPVVTVQGSGEETRDFIHEEDMAAAVIALLSRLDEPFAVVNLATGQSRRVRDVAETMKRLMGSTKEIRYDNRTRPGDPLHWAADVSSLNELAPPLAGGAAYDFEGRLAATLAAWAGRLGDSVEDTDQTPPDFHCT